MVDTTKTTTLTQPALFLASRSIFPENTNIIHPYHLILMLSTTRKGTGGAQNTLLGDTNAPRHPTNKAMPSIYNLMTTKYPTTLFIYLHVVICYQYNLYHQIPYLVLLNTPHLPGTFQNTEFGTIQILKLTWHRKSSFFLWVHCIWYPLSSYIM